MNFNNKFYDSDKSEQYMEVYSDAFEKLKNKPVALLELGVNRAGSLLLWSDFFDQGSIAGLDINKVEFDDKGGRIRFYQGSQTDLNLLKKITDESTSGGFDIIIDDASHKGEETFISFVYLFNKCLKPGGIYVVEDWGTGYWSKYPTGNDAKLDKRHVSYHLHNETDFMPGKNLLQNKDRYPGHDYGMVGIVKQLVDEVGFFDLTNPKYTEYKTTVKPAISKIIYAHGQVIIYKSL